MLTERNFGVFDDFIESTKQSFSAVFFYDSIEVSPIHPVSLAPGATIEKTAFFARETAARVREDVFLRRGELFGVERYQE